ncbi:hypothetical protein FQA39_LY11647 [Lamprigera yunnana]|nr:hypothetical protein FQA39_LY11647 [Lamprigera yunnana]
MLIESTQKLKETRVEIRTEMDQSMEKIQRQSMIQQRVNAKWEKKTIGDGKTMDTDNTKTHTDVENRRRREEMKEPLKDMNMRIIDQWSNYEEYFVEGNKEDEELQNNVDKEININNVNIRRDAESGNPNGMNGIKEEMCDKR